MKQICKCFFAICVILLGLTGCSVVVFEDGQECLAETSCPVETLSQVNIDAVPENPILEKPLSLETQKPEPQKEIELPVEEVLVVSPVVDGFVSNFDYDSAEIRPKALKELEAIAVFLVEETDIKLLIEGHCDERGSREYNLALGDRRAVAMRDFLVAQGVSIDRLKTISFGKERPVAVGSSPEIWARNRRAVIRQLTQ